MLALRQWLDLAILLSVPALQYIVLLLLRHDMNTDGVLANVIKMFADTNPEPDSLVNIGDKVEEEIMIKKKNTLRGK